MLTYFLVIVGQRKSKLLPIFFILLSIVTITTLCLLINVSTTSLEFDFILISSYYFGICFLIWIMVRAESKFIRIPGYLIMVLVFGLGYFSGTVGVLGIGFITAEFVPTLEDKVDTNLTYKEISLGNAVSDNRGVRIEIFKHFKYLPFLERKIASNDYYGIFLARYRINHIYDKNDKIFYLSLQVPDQSQHKIEWSQEIKLP